MTHSELYFRQPCHIGVATDDIYRAIAFLSPRCRLEWEEPRFRVLDLAARADRVEWWLRVAHSSGPMDIELLQGSPGSVWHTDRSLCLHHYGYQSEHFSEELAALRACGWELELTLPDAAGEPSVFAYLTREDSPRIELIAIDHLSANRDEMG